MHGINAPELTQLDLLVIYAGGLVLGPGIVLLSVASLYDGYVRPLQRPAARKDRWVGWVGLAFGSVMTWLFFFR